MRDLDVEFPPGRWRGRWIWPVDLVFDRQGRRTAAMRRTLELPDVPDSLPVRVLADARYVLLVNGHEVARGPIRTDPRRRRTDVVELAPFLRAGRNVIAALVAFYGTPRPWWMPVPLNSSEVQNGGFVLEAHPSAPTELVTDQRWVGKVLDGWEDGPGGGVSGRFLEVIDLRTLPDDWATADVAPDDWQPVRELKANATGEPGRPQPPTYPWGPLPVSPLPRPSHEAIGLDLDVATGTWTSDRVVVGPLEIDIEGAPGATVDLLTGEFLGPDGLRAGPHQEELGATIVCDGTRRRIWTIDAYGLRGVRVRADGDARVHSVTVHERLHPVRGDASFACSDPALERIWAVGRRTVSLCSLDAYVDCATREQRAWTGDAVVHQLVDLTTNEDWSLARWNVHLTAAPRADGMLPMVAAGDATHHDIAVIPDWALHWIHALHNLWRYVGDHDEIARLLPVAEGVLRWFEDHADEAGLPYDVTGWVIIDWAAIHTSGWSVPLIGLLGRALVEFEQMATWLGDAGRASWARAWHGRLAAAFDRFWDPDRALYVTNLSAFSDVADAPASQHAQAAAIVGHLAPPDRWDRLVDVMLDDSRFVHATFSVDHAAEPNSEVEVGGAFLQAGEPDAWWDVREQVVVAQPFFRYVVHDAVVTAGRGEEIARLCRDWTRALDRCATSWTETWFGGTVSHGWSSTPTRDLVQHVLGVQPAEPGFGRVTVAPALGDLAWARGTVPTPAGPLHLEVTQDKIVLDTPLPASVGDVQLQPGQHTVSR